MAFFMDPGAMFLGCLNGVEQKFLIELIKTARRSGYTRFVEPCAGTFAMANLAVQSGFKPEQIETSDVNMMTSVMGYAITGQSLEPLQIHAQGFSDEELLDPAVALYAQIYLRTSKSAGNEYFHNILRDLHDRREEHIESIRRQLESLPLLVEKDGVLEIISGHHRIKSARAAGMKEIIAIIDVSGLSRSKIASKQLAHNAISGFDDPSILREICKMLDDVDDMLESFIGKDIMEEPLEQYDKLLSPAVHFDFKNITFSFLPHQVKDMDALVKNLESSAPEIIGVAPYEQCKQFIEALARYQKFSDIRNVGAAIHSMIESATEKMDEVGFKDDEEWTYLTKIFGSNAIPAESAATITKAIKKAEKDGAITSKNRWQLIEMLATEYLAGK